MFSPIFSVWAFEKLNKLIKKEIITNIHKKIVDSEFKIGESLNFEKDLADFCK